MTGNTEFRNVHNGANALSFAYEFTIYDAEDIQVLQANLDGSGRAVMSPSDYTVTGVGNPSGGTVDFASAVSSSLLVILELKTPFTQTMDLTTADDFPAEATESAMDRIVSQINRLRATLARCFQLPDSTPVTSAPLLPDYSIASNQGKALSISASGYTTVELSADPIANPLSTKGDILVRDASGPARLPVGSNDQILVANSATGTGLQYKALETLTAWATVVNFSAAIASQNRNPIVNPYFDVWQRGSQFAGITGGSSTFTADRYKVVGVSTSGVVTVNRSTDVPTPAQCGTVLTASHEVDVTTADVSIAAGDAMYLEHVMHGFDWRHFAQQSFFISFWVKSSKTGAHGFSIANSANDRTFPCVYVVQAADTWEFKTLAVTASPSAGTWLYDSGKGAQFRWSLCGGSNYVGGSLQAWGTTGGVILGSSAVVNCLDSTSNFFRIAGLRISRGSASGFPLEDVSFDTEWRRCLYTYQKSFSYGVTPVQNVGNTTGAFAFPSSVGASASLISPQCKLALPMRIVPTITFFNPNAANAQLRNTGLGSDCSATTTANASEGSFNVTATTPGSTAVGHAMAAHWTADCEL